MSTEVSSDSALGNQGSQDFASMVSVGGSQGPSTAGKSPVPGGATGPSGVPTKTAAQIDAEQGVVDGTLTTPETGAQPGQVTNPLQAGQGGDGTTTPPAAQTNSDVIKATVDAMIAAQNAARQQQAPAQQQAEKTLSPQEFDAKYKVARANQELVTTILGQDPVKAASALNTYGQNLVQQAVLMALDLTDANVSKVRSEFAPHISSWQNHQQQIQAQQAEDRFFKGHPDLNAERDLVMELKDAYIAKVQSGQVRFNNEQEAFSTVANAARNILTKIRGGAAAPGGGQGGQGNVPAAPSTGSRQMSAAASAGRTGTGRAAVKTDGEQVFGDSWK
tara:strand:+ start:196 stop:1194 length:999 start_codon:yes stop_codon:yes gene_type:complete